MSGGRVVLAVLIALALQCACSAIPWVMATSKKSAAF